MAYRSVWKIPFVNNNLKIFSLVKFLVNVCRKSSITPGFVNKKVRIYNGKRFVKVRLTNKHCGLKFGDFAFTKTLAYVKKSFKKGKRIVKQHLKKKSKK